MTFFKFNKKESKVETCRCNKESKEQEPATCNYNEEADISRACTGWQETVYSIKVLGSGCKSCHQLYENAKKAVASMQMDVEVEYITDLQQVMEYGIMSMPALVFDEKVVSAGRVLKSEDIEKLLKK